MLLPALVVSLVCFVWVPDIPSSGSHDLDDQYFKSARWTLPLIALWMFLGGIADLILPSGLAPPFWFLAAWASIFLGLVFTRSRAAHITGFSVFWAIYIAGMSLWVQAQ